MKRFFSLIVCLAFLVLCVPSFAARYDREAGSPGFVNAVTRVTSGVVVSDPVEVYALTVYATNANTHAELYDKTSAPVTSDSDYHTPKLEAGQATQYVSTRYEYKVPVKFDNGIYATVTNGAVIVEYR